MTETALRLKGEILDDSDPMLNAVVNIDPFGLHLVMGETKNEYTIKLKNVLDEPVGATLVSTHPEYFNVKLPDREIKPGQTGEIRVSFPNLNAYTESGFDKSFTVEFSDSAKTRFTFPVSYHKEQAQAPVQAHSDAGSTVVTPSGAKTKNGTSIDVINAGTNRKVVTKGQ